MLTVSTTRCASCLLPPAPGAWLCGPAILCGSRHPHAWFVACPDANCAQSTCLMLLA
jgi:hypothetical protein